MEYQADLGIRFKPRLRSCKFLHRFFFCFLFILLSSMLVAPKKKTERGALYGISHTLIRCAGRRPVYYLALLGSWSSLMYLPTLSSIPKVR